MRRKTISIILIVALCVLQGSTGFAADMIPAKKDTETRNKTVFGYMRKDAKIKMNDKVYIFYDANANRVYPIFYGGTAYLPVRGMASMLEKNIDWEKSNRTVYIGRTLQDADTDKPKPGTDYKAYAVGIDSGNYSDQGQGVEQVSMQVRGDIRVLYNFEEKEMLDESGAKVYPVIFKGSTYLPIRAVSKLLNKKIEWEKLDSAIIISEQESKEDTKPKDPEGDKKQDPNDDKAEQERKNAIFKKAAQTEYKMLGELSKHATDNLLMLRKEENPENKMKYAQAITDICNNLDSKRFNFEDYKIDKISEEQKKVQDAINEYAQMLWHYTLVMENISYLAAGEQDFSMLSETFVNFALITQQKEQQAAKLLEELK